MCVDDTSPCTYCRATAGLVLYETVDTAGDRWTINRCRRCDCRFLAPPPTPAQLARAYDTSYYGDGDEKFDGPVERVLDYFRRRRARYVARRAGPGGRVLDVGCGNGRFLGFVRDAGTADIHGIERDGKAASRAARVPGLQLKVGDLEAGDFPAASVDAVTLFHVFEHLDEPAQLLATVRDILRPGGLLMLSFPNIDSLQSRWFRGRWLHLDPPRHLFFFAPPTLVRLLRDLGFELLRERHFHVEHNPFGLQQSLLNLLTAKRDVLFESLKGNRAYVRGARGLGLQRALCVATAPLCVAVAAVEALCRRGATVELVLRRATDPAGASSGGAATQRGGRTCRSDRTA